MQVDYNISDV